MTKRLISPRGVEVVVDDATASMLVGYKPVAEKVQRKSAPKRAQ